MQYSFYNDQGEIYKTIDSPISIKTNGLAYIDGIFDRSKYYIDLNTKTPVLFPAQPSSNHSWSWSKLSWEFNNEKAVFEIKTTRSKLLSDSDWTQLPNSPLTSAKQQEWATYRQALRDITTQSGYPQNVVWPNQPG